MPREFAVEKSSTLVNAVARQ